MLKKEFESVFWLPHEVKAEVKDFSFEQLKFFNRPSTYWGNGAILPEGIAYVDLLAFVGKKTKVTIETLE